ncbi:hypothetical protein SAMN02799622_00815 [Methylobacterium sp. UNC378MF]|uniref:hypothetical protein n=1 Tax=Methylobacterium sp. UNC378MF TaxID=1502748 RepID=UPI000883B51A|nr:hypothetical protein [Methylobacterium sp. UNC378MF]SDA12804.1 hypothetical protein SAMN02799622_00815 [Methylobacterium sp. UNC378MF]
MTDEQKGYLKALSDVRAWHQLQIGQKFEDTRGREGPEAAVAWLDLLIAATEERAAEDEAEQHAQRHPSTSPRSRR